MNENNTKQLVGGAFVAAALGAIYWGISNFTKVIVKKEPKPNRVAVVTGGSINSIGSGIVLELAKHENIHVIFTCRSQEKVDAALKYYKQFGMVDNVEGQVLDVTVDQSLTDFCDTVLKKHGCVDILVNNAGVMKKIVPFEQTDIGVVKQVFDVNTLGPLKLIQKFLPGMKKKGFGRIVNVSSRLGQLCEMGGKFVSYRISKTALNAITKIVAADVKEFKDIKVSSCCPGFIATNLAKDLGISYKTAKPISQGAQTPVFLALLPKSAPSGLFWAEKKIIPW